jgi:hypothetical protein
VRWGRDESRAGSAPLTSQRVWHWHRAAHIGVLYVLKIQSAWTVVLNVSHFRICGLLSVSAHVSPRLSTDRVDRRRLIRL